MAVSEENLLSYVRGNKLWHDNSIMSNTFLSFYKGGWYWHEFNEIQNNENNWGDWDNWNIITPVDDRPIDLYDNP